MSAGFAHVLDAAALALLLTLLVGLWRVFRGPHAEDRMLAGQLFGTTGVCILLILSVRSGVPSLRDVALVLALLAVVTVSAFVGRVGSAPVSGHWETSRWLLFPTVATALFTVAAGVLAGFPFSPLQWAILIARREYLP